MVRSFGKVKIATELEISNFVAWHVQNFALTKKSFNLSVQTIVDIKNCSFIFRETNQESKQKKANVECLLAKKKQNCKVTLAKTFLLTFLCEVCSEEILPFNGVL